MSMHEIHEAKRRSKALIVEFTRAVADLQSLPITVEIFERSSHGTPHKRLHLIRAPNFAKAIEYAGNWLRDLDEKTTLIQHINTGK